MELQQEGAAQRKLQRTKSVGVMAGIKVDSERELRTSRPTVCRSV